MKISVIMPVFNRRDFIGAALRSLLCQRDAAELDIIVVDDGSTDGTTDIVTGFARREHCIRLVKQENRGISNARNTGIKHLLADTELVAFLDSDDVSMPNCFAMAVPSFRADPDLALTYALMTVTSKIDDETLAPASNARTHTLRGIHLSAALFRKSTIDELGGFNEKFVQAEDWDFLLRFFERPRKYLLLDHVAFIYRRHAGNITRDHKEVYNHFLRVLLTHAQKRRRDPTLGGVPKFFEYAKMFDGDDEPGVGNP